MELDTRFQRLIGERDPEIDANHDKARPVWLGRRWPTDKPPSFLDLFRTCSPDSGQKWYRSILKLYKLQYIYTHIYIYALFFLYLWYVWQTQGPKVPEILEVAATLNQPLLMHILAFHWIWRLIVWCSAVGRSTTSWSLRENGSRLRCCFQVALKDPNKPPGALGLSHSTGDSTTYKSLGTWVSLACELHGNC